MRAEILKIHKNMLVVRIPKISDNSSWGIRAYNFTRPKKEMQK